MPESSLAPRGRVCGTAPAPGGTSLPFPGRPARATGTASTAGRPSDTPTRGDATVGSRVARWRAREAVIGVVFASLWLAGLVPGGAQASILGKSPEISIGRETAALVEKYYKVDRDPVAAARVRQI